MTVAGLIAALQEMPSDTPVYYIDSEWGAEPIDYALYTGGVRADGTYSGPGVVLG